MKKMKTQIRFCEVLIAIIVSFKLYTYLRYGGPKEEILFSVCGAILWTLVCEVVFVYPEVKKLDVTKYFIRVFQVFTAVSSLIGILYGLIAKGDFIGSLCILGVCSGLYFASVLVLLYHLKQDPEVR